MRSQQPASASSRSSPSTSQTRWCRPCVTVEPMYMPGRLRTASRPSRTWMAEASNDGGAAEVRLALDHGSVALLDRAAGLGGPGPRAREPSHATRPTWAWGVSSGTDTARLRDGAEVSDQVVSSSRDAGNDPVRHQALSAAVNGGQVHRSGAERARKVADRGPRSGHLRGLLDRGRRESHTGDGRSGAQLGPLALRSGRETFSRRCRADLAVPHRAPRLCSSAAGRAMHVDERDGALAGPAG